MKKHTLYCLMALTFSVVSCGTEEANESGKNSENGIEGSWIIKHAEGPAASAWEGIPVDITNNTISMNQVEPCPYTMSGDTLTQNCTFYMNGDKNSPFIQTDQLIVKLDGKKLTLTNIANGQIFDLEKK